MILKRSLVITLGLFIAMFIVACGGNTTTGGGPYGSGSSNPPTTTTPPATTTPTTGGCAQMWPPLLSTGSGAPTSSTTLAGKLSVQMDANGNQVEYNGHPLYTFSGDTAPGQTNGEGLFGMWFVATPNL